MSWRDWSLLYMMEMVRRNLLNHITGRVPPGEGDKNEMRGQFLKIVVMFSNINNSINSHRK